MNNEAMKSVVNLLLLNMKHCTKDQLDKLSFAVWVQQQELSMQQQENIKGE